MQQPLWKKILSYTTELELERTQSIYNEELTVSLVKGEYQLSTNEAIYSYGKRYDNYYSAFHKINLDRVGPEVLLLGLGLGSIPYMLETSFDKDFKYTAIEIDEEVMYLASKYVLDDLKSEIYTLKADASHFIELNESCFDMIAMDVFVSDYIPEEFETKTFLAKLKSTICKDGLLLFNRLYYFEKDKRRTEKYFRDTFMPLFPDGGKIDIDGNWILVSDMSYVL